MTSIIVCDDHPLILGGLSALLATDPEWQVLATVQDGLEARKAIGERRPDIALLDVSMPGCTGIELLKAINQEGWPVRVILLTATITDEQVVDAVTAGVAGIVLKESEFTTLVHCLTTVSRGGRWLPHEIVRPALSRRAASGRGPHPLASLTRREAEVARLVAEGRSNRDIAVALGMSEGTVKIHLHTIYSKLQVDNRTAVAIIVLRSDAVGSLQ